MLVLILGMYTALAECPFDYARSLEDAAAKLDAVDGATTPEAVERAAQGVDAVLQCLAEPITPALAGRYHRAVALALDPHGLDTASRADKPSVQSLAASYAIDPEARHAVKLDADHGHFSVLSFPEQSFVAVGAPEVGAVFFDGTEGLQRPTNTATYFQRVDGEGRVVQADYLLPSAAIPTYPLAPDLEPEAVVAEPVEPDPEGPAVGTQPIETPALQRSARKPLRAVGIGLGVAALGALGANAALYGSAMNPDTSSASNAESKAGLVNALGATSIVLGVGAGGMLGASFVVR
ncbi:MAG: hypothetical protein KC912_20580 [Proteobacteria bacterium]|nr:hypothetical protein [Pseudomonadota bacterium]